MRPSIRRPDLQEARTSAGLLIRVGSYWTGDGYKARKLIELGYRHDGRLSARLWSGTHRTWVLVGPAGPGSATPLDEAAGKSVLGA